MNRLTRRTLPIRTVRSEATERQAYAGCGNAGLTKRFRRDFERLDAWVAGPEESRVNTITWGSQAKCGPLLRTNIANMHLVHQPEDHRCEPYCLIISGYVSGSEMR